MVPRRYSHDEIRAFSHAESRGDNNSKKMIGAAAEKNITTFGIQLAWIPFS